MSEDVLLFYGWWEMIVCLFAFCALIGIWWHIGRIQKDYGQVWLALSILCWSLSGGVEVIFMHQSWLPNHSGLLEGIRSIFSLFNSLFILLALPWFKYLPDIVAPFVKSNYWKFIIGLPFIFSLLPTISKMITSSEAIFISELDVYYSIFTLVFLAIVLWESFSKRNLKILAYLSTICILITLVAQLFKFSGNQFNMILLSGIFKTTLIMIFFALALSWVRELSQNIFPAPNKLFLSLQHANTKDKLQHSVQINGFLDNRIRSMKLTPSSYELLHKFVDARIKPDQQWLEIKPKGESRPNKTYAINDYNEIKRLLGGLLDGIYGKNSWTRDEHESLLKSTLFEMSRKRDRKIMLKIPAENLKVV